ncbi:MAG: hypothetical protein JW951_05870, partial [Lentisphaerae bacterium]|nr:hypothetical protein [Lentisphaerota bacterium]
TGAGIAEANHIACWDGAGWSALGFGVNGPVHAVLVLKGEVYATGAFTLAGGGAADRLARWDGDAWHEVSGGLGNTGRALAYADGALYVGGAFREAGAGVASYRLARLFDGTADCDRDGLPDAWELRISGGHVYCDPFTDQDGDTVPGLAEYGADTDPFDAGSYLRITGIGREGSVSRVYFPSSSNRWYRLHRAAVLPGPEPWTPVGSGVRGTGGDGYLSDTNTGAALFYRVGAGPDTF